MKKWVYSIIGVFGSIVGTIGAMTTAGLVEMGVKSLKEKKKPPETESKEES